jgi:YbgC/YbaW family acyl-CoA thioester hydrolase
MTEPLRLYETRIKPEWIDSYQHMNVAHYITVCDQANWEFWRLVNGDRDMEARDGHEYVIVENHVHYINEVVLDAEVYVTTQLLACDDKRFILFHNVWRVSDGALSATNEVKSLGFDLNTRRIEAFLPDVQARLNDVMAQHKDLPIPDAAGKGIALSRR